MIDNKIFKEPDSVYRPAAFWGLNGLLEADELKRQINVFHGQGMGGVYLHPRGGMETEYLGAEYFSALEVCIEEAKRLNINAWLYDEDWCPSGKAGDKVLRSDHNFALKYIRLSPEEPSGYSVVQIPVDESSYRHVNIDVCDEKAVSRFIEITYEKYYEEFKQYFGNVIPAIFTDEPNFKPEKPNALPWTKDFESKFRQKYGYDLSGHIKDLFSDSKSAAKTKFHYWDLISSLFVESFTKQIFDWCQSKGIAFTGHYWEHSFPSPMHGGSVMPHYEYMDYPGIDMLFIADENSPEQYGNDFIVKEASSVANQLGKKRVLSESNGASGWRLDFAYQKRAADWQLALGVNLFVPHLSYYSMIGYRKRDFPMSYHEHQPWWENFHIVTDYIGRMSYALSQGKYAADVLVLHPSSSTWTANAEESVRLEKSVKTLVKNLGQLRIMYDLGDDVIISRHGEAADGKIRVGNMEYKIIVMPEMHVLRNDVFMLLNEFLKTGGLILCAGKTPYLLDGESSDELIRFFSDDKIIKIANEITVLSDLFTASDSIIPAVERINITETNGKDISNIYGHIRTDGNHKTVFLCNLCMEQEESRDLILWIEQPYETTILNAETGESSPCGIFSDNNTGRYYIKAELNALQSVLFCINKNKIVKTQEENPKNISEKVIALSDWTIRLNDLNAINLQFCRASLDGGPYSELSDVLKLDDQLKDSLGIERGVIFTREPWMYSSEEKNDRHYIEAEYPFYIEEIPAGSLIAAVELPDQFGVFINGTEIKPTGGYFKDRAFAVYDIKNHVKKGCNIIRIATRDYGVLINLESIYVAGDFSLKNIDGEYHIAATRKIYTGNIAEQGYPYYSGKIEYCAEVEIPDACDYDKAWLTFNKYDGVSATIKVNGEKIAVIGWSPYKADLTGKLNPGKNTVVIEIANSLQNLLGPFGTHANQNLVHPGSFYAEKHEVFMPVGFNGGATIHLSFKQ